MSYWDAIWRTIRSERPSTCRNSKGELTLRDGGSFRPVSVSANMSIIDMMEQTQKDMVGSLVDKGYNPRSAREVRESAGRMAMDLLDYKPNGDSRIRRVSDNIMNVSTGSNVPGQDVNLDVGLLPNLWISPGEAASIYSQAGLPGYIIDKKSKSVVKNGIRINNPKLSLKQLDIVKESVIKTGLAQALSESITSGLTYGGSLLFPFFKRDMPATAIMDIQSLLRYDVLGKNSISRYVSLDRNNVIHIPNYNPTSADFLNPKYYFIPYLGSDVNGMRCARIVPLPQTGYWGVLVTMGWGNSDIQGWYQAVCNYEGIASSIPHMIKQMSILVHSYNMDLANAMNGAAALTEVMSENTERIRQASQNNPINMEIVGTLEAIKRDFTAVAELSRITRQDVAAKARMPEEMIWSSDRGAFASGDQTDGINERQWEGIKYIFGEIEARCKNIACIEVINALGKDYDVMKALPYTTLEILPPRIENPEKRATVISVLAEGTFNLVASGMQLDSALSIMLPYGDEHLAPSSEVIQKVVEHQAEVDAMEKEKHEKEIELMDKQIETAGQMGVAPKKPGAGGKGKGYTKLEQRSKEKTRGAYSRREGVQKAQGKMV